MGTNYYVRTPGCARACEHCSEADLIHLGKSSAGWRFGFKAAPDWPRERAYELWLERAKSGKVEDEYGEEVTLDELIDLIHNIRKGKSRLTPDPDLLESFGKYLYQSIRSTQFTCEGHDFETREFS